MSYTNKTHIIFLLLGIIFIIPCLAYGQQPERWQFVGRNDNGSRSYLENSNQRRIGNKRQTWTKDIYKDSSYKITLIEWQCREKKFRILEATNYAPEGTYLGQEAGSDWSTVVPDSVSENYFKTICAAEQTASESDLPNTKKSVLVITENANVRETPFSVSPVVQTLTKGTRVILADDDPVGAYYQVFLPNSDEVGWLHGNTIKILKTEPNRSRSARKSKLVVKRQTKRSN